MITESESQPYLAHQFQLENKSVKFRMAKITPTKTGQFVTVWKRNAQGITEPFEVSDNFDFYFIAVSKEDCFGVFIFSKKILLEHQVLSNGKINGKRGIRVYPPWDLAGNKQAEKTQKWQTQCFLKLPWNENIDLKKAKELLLINSF